MSYWLVAGLDSSVHTVQWRRLDLNGSDRATLAETDSGYLLLGHAKFQENNGLYDLHYSAETDTAWRTRQARVDGLGPQGAIAFHVVAADGIWRLNGKIMPGVDGCIDLDLAFTPATNLISIRRLSLGSGQTGEVTAAWLDFPNPGLEPLRQIYARREDGRYDYRCPDQSFDSTLVVDTSGFVTSYPPFWAPAFDG